MTGTSYADDGTVFTVGVAASEIAVVEFRSALGSSRSEVGVFGAVIFAAEHPPAEVVLLDADGDELNGRWHPQIHTDFIARATLRRDAPQDGRY